MAVETSTIPTIVPGITKLGEAVGSANETIERVNALSVLSNASEASIGSLQSLETTQKNTLVDAINEMVGIFRNGFLVESITGNTLNLSTINKQNLVAAINEVHDGVGDLSGLATSTKINIVAAINEAYAQTNSMGSVNDLVTQSRFSLVDAINELSFIIGSPRNMNTGQVDLISSLNSIFLKVGDLTFLDTTEKTSIVDAINEIHGTSDLYFRRDGANRPLNDIDFNQKLIKNLGAGVNENDAVTVSQVPSLARTGNLTSLLTDDKTSLVAAINEITDAIGGLVNLDTDDKTSLVAAINEIIVEADFSTKQDRVETVSSLAFGKELATNTSRTLSFFATTGSSSVFDITRLGGADGAVEFVNSGTGFFNIGYTGNPVLRVRPDATNPLQLKISGVWENVPTSGNILEKSGGTMTGALNFGLTPSSDTKIMDLANGFNLFSDNVGTGGAAARLWFDKTGPVGEMIFGPKSVGVKLLNFTVRSTTSTFEGDVVATGDIEGLSDARVKSNFLEINDPLDKVSQMHGLHYDKDGEFKTGVIAQELLEVAPELVTVPADGGLMSVNYMGIIPYLIESIKELKREVEILKEAR